VDELILSKPDVPGRGCRNDVFEVWEPEEMPNVGELMGDRAEINGNTITDDLLPENGKFDSIHDILQMVLPIKGPYRSGSIERVEPNIANTELLTAFLAPFDKAGILSIGLFGFIC
jgi:hypothetical protein